MDVKTQLKALNEKKYTTVGKIRFPSGLWYGRFEVADIYTFISYDEAQNTVKMRNRQTSKVEATNANFILPLPME